MQEGFPAGESARAEQRRGHSRAAPAAPQIAPAPGAAQPPARTATHPRCTTTQTSSIRGQRLLDQDRQYRFLFPSASTRVCSGSARCPAAVITALLIFKRTPHLHSRRKTMEPCRTAMPFRRQPSFSTFSSSK